MNLKFRDEAAAEYNSEFKEIHFKIHTNVEIPSYPDLS